MPARSRSINRLVLLTALLGLSASPPGAQAQDSPAQATTAIPSSAPDGFLYGRLETRGGTVYEGRLRWNEETFWDDLFNSRKRERPYLKMAPDRPQEKPLEIFGITFGSPRDAERSFAVRFRDLAAIEVGSRDGAHLELRDGSTLAIDGGSNDLGGRVRVYDPGLGVTAISWRQIESIHFQPAPADLMTDGHRLYGTAQTRAGELRGFLQWDQDECLSTDTLDGEIRDGDLEIPMGRLASIEPRGPRARVTLRDGRNLEMNGTNDVDSSNRGLFVDDPRYGRVLVPWNALERVDFETPPPTESGNLSSGAPYSAPVDTDALADTDAPSTTSSSSAALHGTVHRVDGAPLSGRLVYGLDQAETWELLRGESQDLRYHIPFHRIAEIEPEGPDASRVTFVGGETLELSGTHDVGEGHLGVLVFTDASPEPTYLRWEEVRRVELEGGI